MQIVADALNKNGHFFSRETPSTRYNKADKFELDVWLKLFGERWERVCRFREFCFLMLLMKCASADIPGVALVHINRFYVKMGR